MSHIQPAVLFGAFETTANIFITNGWLNNGMVERHSINDARGVFIADVIVDTLNTIGSCSNNHVSTMLPIN